MCIKSMFFRWGGTSIFQFYYIVFAREENMSSGKKETVSITTLKIWSFASDFTIKTEDWKVLSALLGGLGGKNCENVHHHVGI